MSETSGHLVGDIEERVKTIIAEELKTEPENLDPDELFFGSLSEDDSDEESDSLSFSSRELAIAEIILKLEAEFGIEIPNDDISSIHTIEEMAVYIEEKLKP
jgi:acyl carrier protein